ncbi:MAG: viroplasmin family protein [Candidatus Marinimicrobia bacterium]|nr:viroplasmin family protein [Candidatus Neomarinimicrobiota bacterium]
MKYFAVIRGYKPGVYESWAGPSGAQCQLAGFPGGLFMSFSSQEEAQAWYEKKIKDSGVPMFQNKWERNQFKYEQSIERYQEAGKLIVYVSTFLQDNRSGAWGIYVDHPSEPQHYSGIVKNTSSYKLELIATKNALQYAAEYENIVISMSYNIAEKGFSKGWPFKWRKNNWKTSEGKRPKELNLWKTILPLFERVQPILLVMPRNDNALGHQMANSLSSNEQKPKHSSHRKPVKLRSKQSRKRKVPRNPQNTYSSSPRRTYSA